MTDTADRPATRATEGEGVRELEMLLSLSARVAALDSFEAVFQTLVDAAIEEIGAVRGSLFLHDDETGELYTQVASDLGSRQIRVLDDVGIAGAVYQSGVPQIVLDAYSDPRFNRLVDEETGFRTESLLAAPVANARGETIGVLELLNKLEGTFSDDHVRLLGRMTTQCATTLESMQLLDRTARARQREVEFLDIVADLTSELELPKLLGKVMSEATRMLDADRATLFLNDEKTSELFSYIADMIDSEIRFPNHLGIAGAVFTSQESIRIPHAYADLRFNPSFDKQTGYFTRSILCVPIFNKQGKAIGVTQALNRRGGPFTVEDESRLRAFTAQIASALENAKLFADVQAMKNYNESMLQSMSSGVITFDSGGVAQTCNAAGTEILRKAESDLVGRPAAEVFRNDEWVVERMARVAETRTPDLAMDAELSFDDQRVSANVTIVPLTSEDAQLGTLVMIEDISTEKRVKSTLARYMDPQLADRLLAAGPQEEVLGGKESVATVLFSDIAGFTSISERLGAHGTVTMLNEYFELMVDCIAEHSGMLDKFIGDAIMAVFGLPMAAEDDAERALQAAVAMIRRLLEWNRGREARSEPPLGTRIGLNTDLVVAGNIGSPKRMDYTTIGDGVNLAARLESACKHYGARILLSESTHAGLRTVHRLREVDKVVVKGKTRPVSIFECLDYHDADSFPNLMEALGAFNEGLVRYREADFEQAVRWFEEALKANPEDALASMYVERSRTMIATPPPADWDGTWVMAEK